MTNPKAGHTSASSMGSNSQGLRDGDGLMSPSLTNLYEGLHGNGIMRLGDGAKGDSLRNSIVANTPGFIEIGAAQGEIKVYGGHCILDGVMYEFAGGPGANETFIVGTTGAGANHSGDLPSVPASNSDVFVVVYLVGRSTPEAHLMYEMGTPAAPSSGTPLIPSRFLSVPSITGNTDANHQTTVLGVLRYTMTGGAGSVTSSLSTSPTIFDRRTYLRTSPMYLTPMTKGSIGNVDKANALTNPDSFFSSPENGDFGGSTFGAIWHSHTEDYSSNKHGVLYAALPRNLNTTPVTNTYALGDRLEVITTTGNVTFEFHQGNIWIVTTDAARTINPSGTFPVGHVVEVYHKAGAHTLHFDSTVGGHGSTPINVNIGVNEYGRFIYDGANWEQISTVTAGTPVASSGANGLVQLSDGAGGFTSDSTLSYDTAANELTVDGKLTVTGLIDPTGMVFTPQATNPESTNPEDTIWIDSETNHLFRGERNVESTVHFNVRNDEGTTIPLGTPLYSKGEIGGSNRIKVGIADASDPNKMPAIGLAMQEMNTTSTKDGNMILTGILNENITITGVVEQDIIYVAPHGGSAPYLTITRPTSASHLVQNVGVCVRQSATNVSQGMKVAAIGRTNDSPNCSFLTVNTESTHPQARRLVAGTNITLTDGGAGGDLTIAATAYTDADAIAAVEGESTLALTGDVGIGGTESGTRFYVEETTDNFPVRIRSSEGNIRTNKYAHIQVQNENASDASSIDDPIWQVGQRDGGQFDIAFGNISTQLVPASKAILSLSRATPTDEASAAQIGFFGTTPASKTAVSALGAQVVTPSSGEPTAADVTATQNAINALQAKLDALITSLSNLGLV